MKTGIVLTLPDTEPVVFRHLVLDFTGTLSKGGRLLEGVADRLARLDQFVDVHVLSADTFGVAGKVLEPLPVRFERITTGNDKAAFVKQVGPTTSVVIGNGRNDVPMAKVARLAIAVCGPEGASCELLQAAHVATSNILDALDLLAEPLRLTATLRP